MTLPLTTSLITALGLGRLLIRQIYSPVSVLFTGCRLSEKDPLINPNRPFSDVDTVVFSFCESYLKSRCPSFLSLPEHLRQRHSRLKTKDFPGSANPGQERLRAVPAVVVSVMISIFGSSKIKQIIISFFFYQPYSILNITILENSFWSINPSIQ